MLYEDCFTAEVFKNPSLLESGYSFIMFNVEAKQGLFKIGVIGVGLGIIVYCMMSKEKKPFSNIIKRRGFIFRNKIYISYVL